MIMASIYPNFPKGYRFVPKDEELIVDYLLKKIQCQPIPVDGIAAVNLYGYNPHTLTVKYPPLGDEEWYFFTPRDRKYPNGSRPKRAAGSGFWKATGPDKRILFEDQVVGFKKTLVYFQGEHKKGKKTDWMMHEYLVDQPPRTKTSAADMRLDDWVLCRIYKKAPRATDNNNNIRESNEQVVDQNQVQEEVDDGTSDHGNQGIVDTYDELLIDGDGDDAYLAIDQWPEFFVGGNYQMQNNASLQVSSFDSPPLSDATFVVDSNLINEDDAGDDCDLFELIMGRKR